MTQTARTLSPETSKKLADLFERMSASQLETLVSAFEADRARGGEGLPHDEILGAIHFRLRRIEESNRWERKEIENALINAPREIRRALPFAPFGGFGATAAPFDLSQAPDAEKLDHAEDYVRRLEALDASAERYGLESELRTARGEVAAILREAASELSKELRSPRSSAAAEAFKQPVLRLARNVLAKWEVQGLEAAARAA
jgi:hypothetical protein